MMCFIDIYKSLKVNKVKKVPALELGKKQELEKEERKKGRKEERSGKMRSGKRENLQKAVRTCRERNFKKQFFHAWQQLLPVLRSAFFRF